MSVPCPLSTYVSKDLACPQAWKGTETETCLYAPMACAVPPTWHALPTPTGVREILLGKPAQPTHSCFHPMKPLPRASPVPATVLGCALRACAPWVGSSKTEGQPHRAKENRARGQSVTRDQETRSPLGWPMSRHGRKMLLGEAIPSTEADGKQFPC